MGKASAAAAATTATTATTAANLMIKKRKKKGRPSLIDIQKRNLLKLKQENQLQKSPIPPNSRRSTRRNLSPELTDDDDERKEKKVKLVVRLPQSIQHSDDLAPSGSPDSGSGHLDSGDEGEINGSGDNGVADQEEKVRKATDTLHGSPLESGPTSTPLPDKKLLVFILDRLQKKDTYGVFSEPVDPTELPDYKEIIEHPMDFGTVRRKLDAGLYLILEQLEADVFLICSNAMQYNSSDTVYHRQARSIQDLAKRDFENLRHEGEDGEMQPKVVRRGRPPSKHLKTPVGGTSVERTGPEISSGATLASSATGTIGGTSKATSGTAKFSGGTAKATGGSTVITGGGTKDTGGGTGDRTRTVEDKDITNGSNGYNLRRAPPVLYRFQSSEAILSSHRSRNSDYSEWLADWNDEFPASILRADMKHGKKHFASIDETRRDTYKQFHPSVFGREPSVLSDLGGNTKQLMLVGLHMEHSYARSLARFALNLGPDVWKIASKKLEKVLPPGTKFGPGFVGEKEAPLQPSHFSAEEQRSSNNLAYDGHSNRPITTSTSGMNKVVTPGFQTKNEMVEVHDRRSNSKNEVAALIAPFAEITSGLMSKPLFNPGRNGFTGVGHNFPSQKGSAIRPVLMTGQSRLEVVPQISAMFPKNGSASTHAALKAEVDSEEHTTLHSGHSIPPTTGSDLEKVAEAVTSGRPSCKTSSPHPRQYPLQVQPDLNVRLQGPVSPSSGLRVGSPQQPDLALQL